MAKPTASEFLTRFPEFSELLEDVVDRAIAEAALSTPETVWSIRHTEAVSQLAAHLLACRSMQIGNQVGTTSGTPAGEMLAASLYGQEYQRMLNTLPITGFVV